MSRTSFRVNLHSIVCLDVKEPLLEAGAICEVQVTATGFEPTKIQFVNEHWAKVAMRIPLLSRYSWFWFSYLENCITALIIIKWELLWYIFLVILLILKVSQENVEKLIINFWYYSSDCQSFYFSELKTLC